MCSKGDRMERVFARIEALTPEYEGLWEQVCSFETPSDNKAALDEQTRFLAAFAREHGFYMQKYCGCVFSEEERYLKKNKIIP